jgi:outer membrane protein TolC
MIRAKTLSAISMAASLVMITGCTNDQEPRFDPRSLGDTERVAARQHIDEPLKPLPTTMQSKYLPDQRDNPNIPPEQPAREPLAPANRVVYMPLREITQRAVANNLNVRVSGYTPAIDETRITEAEARFDPDFFAGATYKASRQQVPQFTGDNSDQWQFEIGVRQQLPSGGQIEVKYAPNRFNLQDPGDDTDGTGYLNNLELNVTQPLLRDFGNDINRARIVINQNNQRISVLDFRKDLEDLLSKIEETYWRLVQANENVRIQESLLQRTMDTADILSKRFGQDVTMEQISTSVSRVESARADLIRAKQRVKDLSDQLKNFMNDDEFPVAGGALLLPKDTPMQSAITFDVKDSLDTALLNRLELGQQQIRTDSATVALKVAKNNLLPQLNLVGSVGTSALGSDFSTSISDTAGGDNINWSLGLQFVQKIGNREALAIYRRAQLQRLQAIEQYRALIDQVTLDIQTTQREVEASWQSIGQNRKARYSAAKALETIEIIEGGGEALSPNFIERKLSRQQELAQAERAEADSIAAYNIAIAKLEQAKGTLLRFNNVTLQENPRKR